MGDFASLIGGSEVMGLDAVPSHADAYYRIESADIFLDRSHDSGFGLVDASGNPNDVRVAMGSGDDVIRTARGDDRIDAGSGNDSVNAGAGDNVVYGGNGDDNLKAGGGNDVLSGGNGKDTIDAGAGDNLADGGEGNDVVFGGGGHDLLMGGNGNDLLSGYNGSDLLWGGNGNDTLIGGGGDDGLIGGNGNDAFLFDSNFGHDVITDFGKGDQLWLAHDVNGSGICKPADLASHVTGGVGMDGAKYTLITIGEDTIRIEGMDKDDFLHKLSDWVKIV
jgi:Ca2+-binding RTX toxin-like protein